MATNTGRTTIVSDFSRAKGKPITSKEKKVILNVWNYFQRTYPKTKVETLTSETAAATGFSVRSVERARAELKKTSKLVTLGKKKPNLSKSKRINCDEFTRSGLRKHVQNFFRLNEHPTTEKLFYAILQDATMPKMSRYKICTLLKEIGFRYRRKKKKNILVEKNDIVHWRIQYLRDIAKYREAGRPIFYLDETWISNSQAKENAVFEESTDNPREPGANGIAARSNDSSSKDGHLVIIDVGSEDGFLDGAGCIFTSDAKYEDFLGDMNGGKFEDWFIDDLLYRLPPSSVIVMDNALYHNRQTDKPPTSASLKKDMQKWLTAHDIPWEPKMLKAELYKLIKEVKIRYRKYKLDELAKANGHSVLRLPPYHCELNPMERVWSKIKAYVASHDISSYEIDNVERLIHEACAQITPALWSAYCMQVKAQEKAMIEYEPIFDRVIDEFIINHGRNDADSDISSDSEIESETDSEEESKMAIEMPNTEPLDLSSTINH